jgi:hypothetical protein
MVASAFLDFGFVDANVNDLSVKPVVSVSSKKIGRFKKYT